MAYDENLANRIRDKFQSLDNVIEKPMMGGLTFMYKDKMCVGIFKNMLMCRINPELQDALIERDGCRVMDFTNRPMNGYIVIEPEGIDNETDFDFYIQLALDFNKNAKASKKRKNEQ